MKVEVNENALNSTLDTGDIIKINYSHDNAIYYLVTEVPKSDRYMLLSLQGNGVYHGSDYENIKEIIDELVGYDYRIYYQDEYVLQLLKSS